MRQPADDTIDLGEVFSRVRRGAGWIVGGTVVGGALAAALALTLPKTYQSTAKVLVRGTDPSGMMASLGSLDRILTGGSAGGGLATEIEILTSRPVLETVIDSLGLQARVSGPDGAVATNRVFSSTSFQPELEEPASYRFERRGAQYQVSGEGVSTTVAPGGTVRLPAGVLALRRQGLPSEFDVVVLDLDDAVALTRKALRADETTGDVVTLGFEAGDPRTASEVPNALVERYLESRTLSDRSSNRDRYRFLVTHTDSLRGELERAESALRAYQESSGVVDPELYGKTEYERSTTLRAEAEDLEVEIRALRNLMQTRGEGISTSELAAYPTFLRNAALNDLLRRIIDLQTRRREMLDRRTEADPDVQVVTTTLEATQKQLVSLSQAYLQGLERQYAEVQSALGGYRSTLEGLPSQVQQSTRLQREVRRLSETLVALQTQLVQARLAALGEGGEVRQIEPAMAPERASSPRPLLWTALGLVLGTVIGLTLALLRGFLDPRVRDARDAELATGLPVVALRAGEPLLLGRLDEHRSVLVLGAGAGADSAAVARSIAATAEMQGRDAALVDLCGAASPAPVALLPAGAGAGGGGQPTRLEESEDGSYVLRAGRASAAEAGRGLRHALDEMEQRFALVVAALPPLSAPATAALLDSERPVVLVARMGLTTKTELGDAVAALSRLGMQASGVVLQGSVNGRRRA